MKPGGRRAVVILQPRDHDLLAEIRTIGVVTSPQAAIIAGFGSKTRVNARLLQLTHAGLLRQSFVGTIAGGRAAVYSTPGSPSGRSLRGGHVEHALAITDVYMSLRVREPHAGVRVTRFEREVRSLRLPDCPIIADAYLELSAASGTRAYFLEVDRGTEARPVWRKKAEAYLALARSGDVQAALGHPTFGVLVVAPSARRTHGVRSAVRQVTGKLFYFTDFNLLKSDGPFAPIWLRPNGDERSPLI